MDLFGRLTYAIASAFLGAIICIAIVYGGDSGGGMTWELLRYFVLPTGIAGFLIGKEFYEFVADVFRFIWKR